MKMSEDLRLLEITKDGEKISLYIKKPSAKDSQEAMLKKGRVIQENISEGGFFKAEMNKELRKRGLISDELEETIKELRDDLAKKIEVLDAGGMKLSEAKKLAIEISDLRNRIIAESRPQQNFSDLSIDGMAEQAEHDYLVSACTVYNDNRKKKYFKDYNDYIERKFDEDAFVISRRFAEIIYDTIFDDSRLPENEFLMKAGFINEDLHFVDKEGHLTDRDGNLVNDKGQLIKYVDGKEVVLEEKKRKPFIDDNGNPIEI